MNDFSKHILIVDDEENLTWSLARSLKRSFVDYEIISTTSGKKAYEILQTKDIDLLISDIKIPDLDGLSLLSYVKKNKPLLKVILMTSFNNSEYRRIADDVQVYFFEKPFDIEDLKNRIQHIFRFKSKKFGKEIQSQNLIHLIKKYYRLKYNGWISLQNGNSFGKIFFENGVITDAIANELKGEMALIHLLSWERVEKAEELPHEKAGQQTIYYGWKLLKKELMAA